jgi:hypothetical protein
MSSTWLRSAALVTTVSLMGIPAHAQAPTSAPASGFAEVVGTATCNIDAPGDSASTGAPRLITGRTVTCQESLGDPWVSGSSTTHRVASDWSGDVGGTGAGVGWGDYTLTAPDGTWSGREYTIASSSGELRTTVVAIGSGAYTGWTYARSATIAADGTAAVTGIVYRGAPPPGYPTGQELVDPDADLGPVPPVDAVTPPVTGSLALGPANGKATSATVGSAGGTIRVTGKKDPLRGLVLTVPAGAYASDTPISVTSQPITGHSYGPLITPISPLITIHAGEGYADTFLTLRVPVSIPDGSFAMGFYVDPTGALEGLPLVAEDATSVTVATRHFSSLVISLVELAALPAIIDSGFRPGIDDWQFTNYGSYIAEGGHCSGQSVSAMWYYLERKRKGGAASLFGRFDDNGGTATPSLWEDDSDGYRLASMVQHGTDWSSFANQLFMHSDRFAPDWLQRAAIRYAIAVTGEPQELFIYAGPSSGHAIVAYRTTRDFIQVADPNYPGKHRAIRWDEAAQDLRPYSSGANAADIAAQGATVYTRIMFAGKSASVDWGAVGRLWDDFDNGTIGDGTFPAPVLEVKDAVGDWVPLTDGHQATAPKLEIRLANPSIAEDVRLQVYSGFETQPIAHVKNANPVATTLDLAGGPVELGFALWEGKPEWPSYEYVDFVRLTVRSAPVGTAFTLHLRFDGACDGFYPDTGYDSWSRVQSIPVFIDERVATVSWYRDGGGKHIEASGSGTFDPATGRLMIPSFSVTYRRDQTNERGEPAPGREVLEGGVSGVVRDDPAVEFESFSMEASGSAVVDYPQLYPSAPKPDPAIACSTAIASAVLDEGWVDVAP